MPSWQVFHPYLLQKLNLFYACNSKTYRYWFSILTNLNKLVLYCWPSFLRAYRRSWKQDLYERRGEVKRIISCMHACALASLFELFHSNRSVCSQYLFNKAILGLSVCGIFFIEIDHSKFFFLPYAKALIILYIQRFIVSNAIVIIFPRLHGISLIISCKQLYFFLKKHIFTCLMSLIN